LFLQRGRILLDEIGEVQQLTPNGTTMARFV